MSAAKGSLLQAKRKVQDELRRLEALEPIDRGAYAAAINTLETCDSPAELHTLIQYYEDHHLGGPPLPVKRKRPSADRPAVSSSRMARAVPPVIEDLEECDGFKPDPAVACTRDELRAALRDFWEWAGSYGCRRVAAASDGAFSHATAAKLIAVDPRVPLKLEYLRGFIAGCGGSEAEQRRWVSAYRRIVQQTREQQTRERQQAREQQVHQRLRAVPGQRASGA